MGENTCSIDGCERLTAARGWCRCHYYRWWRTGNPHQDQLIVKRFDTAAEYFSAHVEKTEHCWIWTGPANEKGYGLASHHQIGKGVRAHRLAYELLVGTIPDGLVIDHRCHNRRCVNPEHLRPVTDKQNKENRLGAAKHNKSGVRGVVWHKTSKKWRAQVGHNGEQIRLGYFDSIAEAEAVVIAKRIELFTHNDRDRLSS